MIDYVITNVNAWEEVTEIEEGNRTESDHIPLEVTIEGPEIVQGERKEVIIRKESIWTEEGVEHYHERCKGWVCTLKDNNQIWRDIKDKVKESLLKKEKKIIPWKIGRRRWHSTEWSKKKRELRRELKKLKKGKITKEEYVNKRKDYRKWCTKERSEFEKKEEEKLRSIRTEEEVWRYINKFRKKKEKIDESINLESWKAHFMDLLRGSEERKTTRIKKGKDEEPEKQERVDEGDEEAEQQQMKEELTRAAEEIEKRKGTGRRRNRK